MPRLFRPYEITPGWSIESSSRPRTAAGRGSSDGRAGHRPGPQPVMWMVVEGARCTPLPPGAAGRVTDRQRMGWPGLGADRTNHLRGRRACVGRNST
jgi:hypothetical protein